MPTEKIGLIFLALLLILAISVFLYLAARARGYRTGEPIELDQEGIPTDDNPFEDGVYEVQVVNVEERLVLFTPKSGKRVVGHFKGKLPEAFLVPRTLTFYSPGDGSSPAWYQT